MRRIVLLLLLVGALGVAGCGSSNSNTPAPSGTPAATTTTVHLAKTKFVIHAALAFGVFHHFIWNPYKSGDLKHPLLHKITFLKAAVAGLFVIHEARLALHAAQGDPLLSKVVAPITAVETGVSTLRTKLLHGQVDSAAFNSANASTSLAEADSNAAGQPISETTAGSGL
jgi:hypothetical protein